MTTRMKSLALARAVLMGIQELLPLAHICPSRGGGVVDISVSGS
jgi:hypothetical protein